MCIILLSIHVLLCHPLPKKQLKWNDQIKHYLKNMNHGCWYFKWLFRIYWCVLDSVLWQDNLVLSTGLIIWSGHCKEIWKLVFRALALCLNELRNCGLCVYVYTERWSYVIGWDMVTCPLIEILQTSFSSCYARWQVPLCWIQYHHHHYQNHLAWNFHLLHDYRVHWFLPDTNKMTEGYMYIE